MPNHEITGSGEQLTKEIERKYLITELPPGLDMANLERYKIDQGYLVVTDDEAVRVRRKGDKFFLTYKGAPTGHAAEKTELETSLTEEQFNTMWPGTEGRRVEKTRYLIPYKGFVIELDIFDGANAGQMMAEVEFPTTDESDIFEPPTWFGQEVTEDKRFGNASIAVHGWPQELAA